MTNPPEKIKGECEGRHDDCSLKGDCPKFGTLRKAGRDGRRRVDGCGDPVARGKRNKRNGGRKQRLAAVRLGIPLTRLAGGHEENYGGHVRIEVKSGGQVGPIWTRFLDAEAQSLARKSVGDTRPFIFRAMPSGTREGLSVIRDSELEAACIAILRGKGILE